MNDVYVSKLERRIRDRIKHVSLIRNQIAFNAGTNSDGVLCLDIKNELHVSFNGYMFHVKSDGRLDDTRFMDTDNVDLYCLNFDFLRKIVNTVLTGNELRW